MYKPLHFRQNIVLPWAVAGHVSFGNEAKLRTFYRILEISPDSSDEAVRESYLRLVKQYHPDSRSNQADSAKFSSVEEAYKKVMVG